MKRCTCEPFCKNPPMVIIDLKGPSFGFKTKRICVIAARTLLADTLANDEEVREENARRALPAPVQGSSSTEKA